MEDHEAASIAFPHLTKSGSAAVAVGPTRLVMTTASARQHKAACSIAAVLHEKSLSALASDRVGIKELSLKCELAVSQAKLPKLLAGCSFPNTHFVQAAATSPHTPHRTTEALSRLLH